MKENSVTFHTYHFFVGGTQETDVEAIIIPEEDKDVLNADLAALGLSGRWKRRVDVEHAKRVLSE